MLWPCAATVHLLKLANRKSGQARIATQAVFTWPLYVRRVSSSHSSPNVGREKIFSFPSCMQGELRALIAKSFVHGSG